MADTMTLLQKYLSDMVSLEEHIYQAIDKQAKQNNDMPEIKAKFAAFAENKRRQKEELQKRLDAIGGAANAPVKEGVAAVLGVAAGVINQFRSEDTSKSLRDDYVAINLSLISYTMLHSTALALNDQETARIAAKNVKDDAEFVMYIQKLIPDIVLQELRNNHGVYTDNDAVSETRELISEMWH